MKMTVSRRTELPRKLPFAVKIKATHTNGQVLVLVAYAKLSEVVASAFHDAEVYDVRLIEEGPE